jgi:hypothetical protein
MIFFCGSVYFGQQVQKTMFIFLQSRSLAQPRLIIVRKKIVEPYREVLVFFTTDGGRQDRLCGLVVSVADYKH